ncbi:hypothetical protein [Nocardiopsis lucentensis]|uniref:hypothetical protein n=1 Tax=Nocardiopsis lucentensis TaxID=53441 RepID=UPI0003454890|nr:hypothetical protein [Nocardiopsis lucentensis]
MADTDLLHRAATLARDTANATHAEAPWERRREAPKSDNDEATWWVATTNVGATVAICGEDHTTAPHDAAHIALWHPGVALAVADWLDSWDGVDLDPHGPLPTDYEHALNIARALLGEA